MNRNYTIEIEKEADGRFIAEIPELPGVMAYGETENQARAKVEALAFRVLAEELEESPTPEVKSFENIAFK